MAEPAWHDFPPMPGLYTELCADGSYRNRMVTETSIWGRGRYYGPRDSEVPDPPPIPEPPKPPRFFTAKIETMDRIGVVFPNGRVRIFNSDGDVCHSGRDENWLRHLYTEIKFLDGNP